MLRNKHYQHEKIPRTQKESWLVVFFCHLHSQMAMTTALAFSHSPSHLQPINPLASELLFQIYLLFLQVGTFKFCHAAKHFVAQLLLFPEVTT